MSERNQLIGMRLNMATLIAVVGAAAAGAWWCATMQATLATVAADVAGLKARELARAHAGETP